MKIVHDILDKELHGDPRELHISMKRGDVEDVEYKIEHFYYKCMGVLRYAFKWAFEMKSYRVIHTLFDLYGMRLHSKYQGRRRKKMASMKKIPKGCVIGTEPDKDLVYRSMRIIHILKEYDGYLMLLEKQSVIYPPGYGHYWLLKAMLKFDKIDIWHTQKLAFEHPDYEILYILSDHGYVYCTAIVRHACIHGHYRVLRDTLKRFGHKCSVHMHHMLICASIHGCEDYV